MKWNQCKDKMPQHGESVVYSKGKGEKVHLNFCPFCGGKLHSVDIGDK